MDISEAGGTNIPKDVNWIRVRDSWDDLKYCSKVFLPLSLFLLICGLLLGYSIYIEENSRYLTGGWDIIMFFCVIIAMPGLLIYIWAFLRVVTFISVDENSISLKYATGAIRKYEWNQVENLVLVGSENPYMTFYTDFLPHRRRGAHFRVDNYEGIINYYENSTGRKVRQFESIFEYGREIPSARQKIRFKSGLKYEE